MEVFSKILLDEKKIYDLVTNSLENKTSLLLTYFNVHCFYLFEKNQVYRNLIDNVFEVYSDGTGIWLLLLKNNIKFKRFNATDLNYNLMKLFVKLKKRIVIIGGDFQNEIIINKSAQAGLLLSGYINGYKSDEEIISKISKLNFDSILIGMGVPKQEFLAYKLSEIYPESVIISVGNFFNFFFEFQRRAPKIFRNLGLEWLYRFYLEPRRLFFRYTIELLNFLPVILSKKIK